MNSKENEKEAAKDGRKKGVTSDSAKEANEGEEMTTANNFVKENSFDQQIFGLKNNQKCHQKKSESGDERLVYFAIERKWRMVGPGVFRK
jgi:hypothetical protein